MRATAEIIVVGAGFAGLSAALYLSRARRDTLVVDAGKSMGRWEPKVENYLGFPGGIDGKLLLERGRAQVARFRVRFQTDYIRSVRGQNGAFELQGENTTYKCQRLLLATGIFHLPPEIPGVDVCLGHSMFFCKDCDGFRVRGKRIAVYGWKNDAVEYALALLAYTPHITIITDGRKPRWDDRHGIWLEQENIPVIRREISDVRRVGPKLQALVMKDGSKIPAEALFTTRGDIMFNQLACSLGAQLDREGQIVTDLCMRTSVQGLYAAGCITTGNCQMIIAAGQGATAAQTINRDLFKQSLQERTTTAQRHAQAHPATKARSYRRHLAAK